MATEADMVQADHEAEVAFFDSQKPKLLVVTEENAKNMLQAAHGEHLPTDVFHLPSTTCVELPQARPDYIGIEELADSIYEGGQLQAAAIAYLNEPHAQEYLQKLSEWYKKDIQLGDRLGEPDDQAILPDEHGMYRFMIFGHRRRRAVKLASIKHSVDNGLEPNPDYLPLTARIYTNVSFMDAKRMQLTENKREDVAGPAEALEVARFYEVGKEDGVFSTQTECAEQLGITVYELKKAIRFTRLPGAVQNLAFDDKIEYSVAATLARLVPYCDDAELYEIADQASRLKWNATTTSSRVSELIAVRKLPDDIQDMIDRELLGQDIAIELAKLSSYQTDAELLSKARRAIIEGWQLEDMRSETRRVTHNAKQEGFDWVVDDQSELYDQQILRDGERASASLELRKATETWSKFVRLASEGLAGGMESILPDAELEQGMREFRTILQQHKEVRAARELDTEAVDELISEVTEFLNDASAEPIELQPNQGETLKL